MADDSKYSQNPGKDIQVDQTEQQFVDNLKTERDTLPLNSKERDDFNKKEVGPAASDLRKKKKADRKVADNLDQTRETAYQKRLKELEEISGDFRNAPGYGSATEGVLSPEMETAANKQILALAKYHGIDTEGKSMNALAGQLSLKKALLSEDERKEIDEAIAGQAGFGQIQIERDELQSKIDTLQAYVDKRIAAGLIVDEKKLQELEGLKEELELKSSDGSEDAFGSTDALVSEPKTKTTTEADVEEKEIEKTKGQDKTLYWGSMIIREQDEWGRPLVLVDPEDPENIQRFKYESPPETDKEGNLIIPEDLDSLDTYKIKDKKTGDFITVVRSGRKLTEAEQIQKDKEAAQKQQLEAENKSRDEQKEVQDEYDENVAGAYAEYKDSKNKAQEAIDDQVGRTKEIIDTLKNSKIDAQRFWNNKTSGQKEASLVAILLGSLSTNANHTNVVLEMLDKNIDRDIAAQKQDLLNVGNAAIASNNLVGKLYQSLNDLNISAGVARLMLKDQFTAKLDAIVLKMTNPIEKAKLEVKIQEQRAATEKERQELIKSAGKALIKKHEKIRTESKIQTNAEVKTYNAAYKDLKVEGLAEGYLNLQTGYFDDSPTGDVAMVQGIARINDPGSVVREAEFKNWSNFTGKLSWEQFKKLRDGLTIGRKLSDKERNGLFRLAEHLMKGKVQRLKDLNNHTSNRIKDGNKKFNLQVNPMSVVRNANMGGFQDYRTRLVKLFQSRVKALKDLSPDEVITWIKGQKKYASIAEKI